ncbi:golgin subfamily A member 4-like [Gossypium australe]|uniref:Golgin subfamily A member 4-like n=1 Tax=Gossypium australe TaxID=47621 RepID=A0A5B6WE66_9ROSI|nr:golgin subfamily A member 4-like [Gossypium australe]
MFCLVTAFDNNQSDAVSSVGGVAPLFLSKNYLDIDNASDLDNASSEISELGTPRQGKDGSAGPSMEHSILEPNLIEPLQKSMKKKVHSGRESDIAGDKVTENNTDRRFLRGDGVEHLPEQDHGKMDGHVRRLSIESIGSDLSSVRASEISNLGIASLFGDGLHDLPESAEASRTLDSLSPDLQFHKDLLILFLSDERHKLKRVLNTLQRRLATANTDMEDLISRLNQEVAVRQFLVTKVKDLEVELETTRENCDENMQQAVLLERERFTQMQWDMELLRKHCLEMELKLKKEQFY